ncbi:MULTISPECIES: glycosyltransferase family 4 protein [Acinetobacter]|uniref:glycosyltransferase family 4 protein n=1 Tax=Acinetobacter TaxID=469 RepID=UPI00257F878C|nr:MULTISPECIES: glycosyltransferase family 4 protein [Acinetobacter]
MKNICFLLGNLNNSGGTERVTTLVGNALSERNFNISILSLVDGKKPFFDLNPSISTYSLYDKKMSFKSNFLSTVWKIRKFVQEFEIDTLIVVDSISCIFTVPALFGLNIKHICWEHFNFNVNLGIKYRNWGRILAAKYCDKIVVLTSRDKELWLEGIKKNKIKSKLVIIPNPNPYENTNIDPYLIREKVIVAAGRLTEQKGFDLLIKAWAKISNQHSEWILKIIGSGEDKESLELLAKNLNVDSSIELIPATKNIEKFYKKASIFCLSSRYEGFGMVILEAQAFGLPVVSFECDCGPSDLIQHEKNGYLIPNEDIDALSKSLSKMMSLSKDNYTEYSYNAYLNANKFNVKNLLNLWLEIV